MSSSDIAASSMIRPSKALASKSGQRHLFGPWLDFLGLGGLSLALMPIMAALPAETYRESVYGFTMLLAIVINHPHFAHSYQIFYRDFARKAFRGDNINLRMRYIAAGIVVPILLVLFFAMCIWQGDVRLLGYAANIMAFLVGWHYVKQGYGMLMVDAVLKRRFFPESDKRVFLANGYIVWAATWLKANSTIHERQLWGLHYYSFDIPAWISDVAVAAAVVAGAATVYVLMCRWKANGGSLPYTGVVAYLVTLYAWMLFVEISPLWLLVVPALHSLQYLVVVYRFQANMETAAPDAAAPPRAKSLQRLRMSRTGERLLGFALAGFFLGLIGFYGAPILLQRLVPVAPDVFGTGLFLFVFWIFINVHHYFLDNVMWRRENPEARQFLFS